MLRSLILLTVLCNFAFTQQEKNQTDYSSSSSSDPSTTWTTTCLPECQVIDITSDSISVQSTCCNVTSNYTLRYQVDSARVHQDKCRCGENIKQLIGDCSWSLSGLCPNTQYILHLEESFTNRINCTYEDIEIQKTKPDVPTEVVWEELKALKDSAIYLKWKEPDCINGDSVVYEVLHWTLGSQIPDNGTTTRDTQMTVGSLSNKTFYNFQVKACNFQKLCNESGTVSIQTMPGVPSKPRDFKIKLVTTSEIVLSWTPPEFPGGPSIDGYQIEYRLEEGGDNKTEDVGRSGATHFDITGLNPGKTYMFSIRAYHKYVKAKMGKIFGKPSDEISGTTDESKPSEPQDLQATSITSSEVTLRWEKPKIKNGSLAGYLVTWTDRDSSHNDTTIDLNYTVHNLLPWRAYDFSISAFNRRGNDTLLGQAAHLQNTTCPDKPSAPTNLTAIAVNSSAIQLSWGQPDDPRGPIDHYNIVCLKDGNDAALENITLTPSEGEPLEHLVSDLQPWTNYTCLIWAVNIDGDQALPGEPSEVTTRTKQDKPSAPRNLEVVNTTSTEVYLTWEEPEDRNGPLDGYELSWYLVGHSDMAEDRVPSRQVKGTSESVIGLLPWREYNFSVLAFNYHYEAQEKFRGPPVSVVERTRPGKPGGPPDQLRITWVEARALGVSWIAPKEANGLIGGYFATLCETGTNDHCLKSDTEPHVLEMNFTKLEPFRTYTVRVSAFNMDGNETLEGPCGNVSTITSVAAPSAPTGLMLKCDHPRLVRVLWKEPEKLHGPLDGYFLQWRKNDSLENTTDENWHNKTIADLQKPAGKEEVEGLAPYTTYLFRVSAFNYLGNKDGSSPTPLYGESAHDNCITEVAAPSAPTGLMLMCDHPMLVRLLWVEPDKLHGPLDGYFLQWRKNDSLENTTDENWHNKTITDLQKPAGKEEVEGLAPYTTYLFRVSAFNYLGNKDGGSPTPLYGESAQDNCITEVAAPTTPIMEVRHVDADFVEVSWAPPDIWNGPRTGYKLTWLLNKCPSPVHGVGCNKTHQVSLGADKQHHILKNLLPWSNYTFGIMAYTTNKEEKHFESPMSAEIIQTNAGVPDYPAGNLTMVEAVDKKIQFIFPKTLFLDVQGPIRRYAVLVTGLDNTANISLYERRHGKEREI